MIIFYYKWIKEYNKIINVETHVTASNANLYVTASETCVSMNLIANGNLSSNTRCNSYSKSYFTVIIIK